MSYTHNFQRLSSSPHRSFPLHVTSFHPVNHYFILFLKSISPTQPTHPPHPPSQSPPSSPLTPPPAYGQSARLAQHFTSPHTCSLISTFLHPPSDGRASVLQIWLLFDLVPRWPIVNPRQLPALPLAMAPPTKHPSLHSPLQPLPKQPQPRQTYARRPPMARALGIEAHA